MINNLRTFPQKRTVIELEKQKNESSTDI